MPIGPPAGPEATSGPVILKANVMHFSRCQYDHSQNVNKGNIVLLAKPVGNRGPRYEIQVALDGQRTAYFLATAQTQICSYWPSRNLQAARQVEVVHLDLKVFAIDGRGNPTTMQSTVSDTTLIFGDALATRKPSSASSQRQTFIGHALFDWASLAHLNVKQYQ
ncbi:hypothetical protein HDU90_003942 [Geranomyces variabilis]|nr:hypothetical protein HDU90_003942 [Geranomyces variabilis]